MHDDNEEQKEKDEDTGPDLKVSSMFSTKSKSQVEPLTPKGSRKWKEKKQTLQTSWLASSAAFLLHSLRGWRLLWTVARHLTTEQLTSCVTTASHLFGIESSKWTCQVAAATETFLGKSSSKANHTRKHWSWFNPCLAYRESAQLEHLPTKPYQASAKGFSRLSWSCNKAFTLAACVSAWASSCPLSKGPWPDFSEILTFNLLGCAVARLRYVVVTRLIALQLSRVKPQALDNSPSPTAPHSCSMGLPCRPGTTRPEFSKKTPYHRSCRVAWRRMLTSYAWLKMLRVLRSLLRIHS